MEQDSQTQASDG